MYVHDFDFYKKQLDVYLPELKQMKLIMKDPKDFMLFNFFALEAGKGDINRSKVSYYRFRKEWIEALKLLGLTFACDHKVVKGFTPHFISRVIGSTTATFDPRLANRKGVSIPNCAKVIRSPYTQIQKLGNGSIKYYIDDFAELLLTHNYELQSVIYRDSSRVHINSQTKSEILRFLLLIEQNYLEIVAREFSLAESMDHPIYNSLEEALEKEDWGLIKNVISTLIASYTFNYYEYDLPNCSQTIEGKIFDELLTLICFRDDTSLCLGDEKYETLKNAPSIEESIERTKKELEIVNNKLFCSYIP